MDTFHIPNIDLEVDKHGIGETLIIATKAKAAELLLHPIEELERSFLTFLHLELLHNIFQRCSPCKFILLSPNIVAELFTWEQCFNERRYITKRLVGQIVPPDDKIEAMDGLWRQTYRKLHWLETKTTAQHKLYFIYDSEPNCLIRNEGETWRFASISPINIRLNKLFKKLSQVRSG